MADSGQQTSSRIVQAVAELKLEVCFHSHFRCLLSHVQAVAELKLEVCFHSHFRCLLSQEEPLTP